MANFMGHTPSIHEVGERELADVNALYARIHFAPSELPRDRTFAACGQRGDIVALGRRNGYPDAVELGGFWVRDDQRGRGLARALVSHVLATLEAGQVAYCIPFVPLVPFYVSLGMRPFACGEQVPPSIAAKLSFCRAEQRRAHYEHAATLLVYTAPVLTEAATASDC